ncbi:MAG TPA: TlpA family protein disulfide reductase [Nitrospirae bacterium]|nr:TlpA family protein disulfide reductase [Nitrospirota bacterium]
MKALERHILFSLCSFLFLYLLLSASVAFSGEGVKVGEPVPTFVLIDDKGKPRDFGELIDRPTIIYFTHNSCWYCEQIIHELKRAEAKFGKKNLRIIGINVMATDEELVKAYKEELDFTFPMFAGNREDVLRTYRINYVPVLVFIDAKRIVRKVVGHYIHEPELFKTIREISK